MIERAAKFFNVEKNMNAEQMGTTAELLVGKYHWWTLDMISLMIDNGMSGNYGDVKYQFDGGIVMSWAVKFELERCKTIAKMSRTEDSESVVEAVRNSQVVLDILKDVLDKQQESKKAKVNQMLSERVTRQESPDLIFEEWCSSQFHSRFKTQGRYDYGQRCVLAYGIWMTETMFLERKYRQRLDLYQRIQNKTNIETLGEQKTDEKK